MLKIKAYDSVGLTDHIKLPPLADLIQYPFYHTLDFEEARKHAPTDLKNIFDKVQLRNDTKYVSVVSYIKVLSQNVTCVPRGNWHFDGSFFNPDDKTHIHLLYSENTSKTLFLKNEIHLPQYDSNSNIADVEVYLNKNQHLIGDYVESEASRFITFDGSYHLHKAVKAKEQDFRFMIRVLESNHIVPVNFANGVVNITYAYNDKVDDYSTIDSEWILKNKSSRFNAVEKFRNGKQIVIHFN